MWFSILTLLLIFQISTALQVGFSESDYSNRENAGPLKIPLSVIGQVHSEVTLEVVPMTLAAYLNMSGTLPLAIQGKDIDPAESGLDFSSASQFVVINKRTDLHKIHVNVDIIDDFVTELEEVFVLHLRDVTNRTGGTTQTQVDLERDTSIVHIKEPASKRTKIAWNVGELVFTEGETKEESGLFMELDHPMELEVSLKLLLQLEGASLIDDLIIPEKITIPANSNGRIPVPVIIKDDRIAEDEECIMIRFTPPEVSLYKIDYNSNHVVRICIEDNDIPKLGIRPRYTNGTSDSGPIEMMEGETKELCVVLLEPEDCTKFIQGSISLASNASRDVILLAQQTGFYSPQWHCFEVTALNNSVINAPVQVRFNINTQVLYDLGLKPGGEQVLIEPGLLTIKDDDGVPITPQEVSLHYEENQVLVSWVATPSKLQPIDVFVVVVQAIATRPISRPNDITQPHDVTRSRRQVQLPPLSPEETWEFETSRTDLILVFSDSSNSYMISVCAKNSLGRQCSLPQELRNEPTKSLPDLSVVTPAGLSGKSLTSERRKSLSFPVVIILAVMVPVILLILCLAVLVVVVMCRCHKQRKEYYPARQGSTQEKIFMRNNVFDEAKYIKREWSLSSISMEWTSGEPYSSRPMSSTPNKLSRNSSVGLGTPV